MAIQAVENEKYANNQKAILDLTGTGDLDAVNAYVSPTTVISATIVCDAVTVTGTEKKEYSVKTLKLEFTSQNGNNVKIDMNAGGTWGKATVTLPTA